MRDPGAAAGAQDTEVTPTGCAWEILARSQPPSGWAVSTEMEPSDEAAARHRPSSGGAQSMPFTLASRECGSSLKIKPAVGEVRRAARAAAAAAAAADLGLRPLAGRGLLPEHDAAVVRGGRQERAEARVRPGHLPHWPVVPRQLRHRAAAAAAAAAQREHLDGAVRRRRRQALAVVVHRRVVHRVAVPPSGGCGGATQPRRVQLLPCLRPGPPWRAARTELRSATTVSAAAAVASAAAADAAGDALPLAKAQAALAEAVQTLQSGNATAVDLRYKLFPLMARWRSSPAAAGGSLTLEGGLEPRETSTGDHDGFWQEAVRRWRDLCEAVAESETLTALHLQGNDLGTYLGAKVGFLEPLADALYRNCSLQVLNMSCNGLSDADVVMLMECVVGSMSLKALYLYGNALGDSAASSISKAIRAGLPLQVLELSLNEIGDAGALALASVVGQRQGLLQPLWLHLSSNRIGLRGIEELSSLEAMPPRLQSFVAGDSWRLGHFGSSQGGDAATGGVFLLGNPGWTELARLSASSYELIDGAKPVAVPAAAPTNDTLLEAASPLGLVAATSQLGAGNEIGDADSGLATASMETVALPLPSEGKAWQSSMDLSGGEQEGCPRQCSSESSALDNNYNEGSSSMLTTYHHEDRDSREQDANSHHLGGQVRLTSCNPARLEELIPKDWKYALQHRAGYTIALARISHQLGEIWARGGQVTPRQELRSIELPAEAIALRICSMLATFVGLCSHTDRSLIVPQFPHDRTKTQSKDDFGDGLAFSNPEYRLNPLYDQDFDYILAALRLHTLELGREWRGVLLLNMAMTYSLEIEPEGSTNRELWLPFCRAILETVAQHHNCIPFAFWGSHESRIVRDTFKEFDHEVKDLPGKKHKCIVEPVPANPRNNFADEENRPFAVINEHLIQNNLDPIDWTLPC
eukprot:SM000272S10272  [mRNA]  locus=s272:46412:52119:+ [translate_table: standard]